MGVGATHTIDRMNASVGLLEATDIEFQLAADVPNGGVLLSLPALLAVGLLRHTEKHFRLPAGFYRLTSIFLLLAFMALARVKSIEALRYWVVSSDLMQSSGPWPDLVCRPCTSVNPVGSTLCLQSPPPSLVYVGFLACCRPQPPEQEQGFGVVVPGHSSLPGG